MEFEDRLSISTPEGVELELTLAGLGSRFVAELVDTVLRLVVLGALALVLVGVDAFTGTPSEGGFGLAALIVLSFLIVFGYDILFEVLASGRTPGKRVSGIRVVRVGGHPITFVPSTIRNLFRIVDWLPGSYVIGCLAILATRRNQRLGDIAAGTLVVRERFAVAPRTETPVISTRAPAPPDTDVAPAWDVSAVTVEELATIRRFLERRYELEPDARLELASALAQRLRPKVAGAPDSLAAEPFLEQLAAAKATRV